MRTRFSLDLLPATNQYWHNHENDDAFSVGNIKLDLDRGKYDEAFNKIKEYLNFNVV